MKHYSLRVNSLRVNGIGFSPLIIAILLSSVASIAANGRGVYAAPSTSVSPSGGTGSPASLGTVVTSSTSASPTTPLTVCTATCVITGGTRAGNNIYHGLDALNIAPLDSVIFQTSIINPAADLSVANILARIADGPSSIYGNLNSATYYPSANLFLLNPAGFLFGPNATLNVGGMLTVTSADYIKHEGGARFNAVPNATADALLSPAPVAAFGFLGSNPGAITVQGSQFTVTPGKSMSLVGGDISIQSGTPEGTTTAQAARLIAPGGQINLVSVGASVGEVSVADFSPTQGMTMGNISLSQGALLDVSANAAGTVRIRGGQLEIAEGTISADTANVSGSPTAIDIQLTGDLSIANDFASALTARTTGAGNSGEIRISSANLVATTNSFDILPFIDTHTSGEGQAGNVRVSTGNIVATGTPDGLVSFIYSGTEGPGRGGDVTITARTLEITDSLGGITTGNFIANLLDIDSTGSAGNVTISADSLKLAFSQIETDAFSYANGTGRSGNITVTSEQIDLTNSAITSAGHEHGGAITISTDQLMATNSQIIVQSNLADGGPVNISGRAIELSSGSSVVSSTGGDGHAGAITIIATDHLGLLRASPGDRPSGIFSNSFGTYGNLGNAGDVLITTPRLEMTGGARINTTTATSGHGGNVLINASTSVSMSGETSGFFRPEPLFSLGTIQPSGIFTRTIGGNCSGACGEAGNVSIATGTLTLNNGGQINSGTNSTGGGGSITINASNTVSLSGTLSDGSPVGIFSRTIGTAPDSGSGGNIALTAGQSVTISDGASVSASSTGPGNAGNIAINAGQQFEMRNSSVKTEAAQASGGNIDIQAIDRIRLVNSSISTSVLGGAGSGGNITIDPNVVILQNSQVIAQAVQGAGGNISIVTPLFLADAGSLVDASSQFGLSGTVNIQSPTSNLAGTVASLPSSLRQVQSLHTGRCAALAHSQSSSLTVAARDILPAEPGGWSPSPFALIMEQTEPLALSSSPIAAMTASADAPVSLRRLTPAGFLTQSFAENGLTGCRA